MAALLIDLTGAQEASQENAVFPDKRCFCLSGIARPPHLRVTESGNCWPAACWLSANRTKFSASDAPRPERCRGPPRVARSPRRLCLLRESCETKLTTQSINKSSISIGRTSLIVVCHDHSLVAPSSFFFFRPAFTWLCFGCFAPWASVSLEAESFLAVLWFT